MVQLKVKEAWLKGLKDPEREEMRQLVINSEKVLDKLKEILYNIQVKKDDTVLDDYNSPSWSHKQAHLNGESAMLKRVIDLVTIQEREDQPTI